MIKRILALLLSLVMVLSTVPAQAFAEETAEETLAPAETEALEETAVSEEMPEEEPQAPEEVPAGETFAPEEEPQAPEEVPAGEASAPAEETQASEAPTGEAEVTVEQTEPSFEAELQPRSASGDCSAEDSWNSTNDVSWSLDDNGTLTVSGSGKMADYSEGNAAPWFSERLNVKNVVIEPGVTEIGNYSFYYCVNLESVTIAESVEFVGSHAFDKCVALKAVKIPAGVEKLYSYAFSGCTSLTQVELPDTLTLISDYVFNGCTALPEITIPSPTTSVSNGAFYGCKALKNVVLPAKLEALSSNLFAGCTALEAIEIPDTVKTIGTSAFSGCVNLKGIQIPSGVTALNDRAFENCRSITQIDLPDGISLISGYAFSGCSGLKEVQIPKGVARIESYAFNGCTSLTKVTMPEGLLTVEYAAFRNCASLDNVVIPKGTASVGESAFSGCQALKNITVADSVISLGERVFSGCSALTNVTIPNSVETVGDEAFRDCTALETVTLSDNLTTLGSYAFAGCTSLQQLELPNKLKSLYHNLFNGCTALTQVDLPDGLEIIGDYAFYNCTALPAIELPETVTAVYRYAFENCDSLREVTLPEGTAELRYRAFYSCDSLEKAVIPASVVSIAEDAFAYCSKLTDITFGHTSEAELSIVADAFHINDNSGYKDLPTTVSVPYARDIHSAIKDYPWAARGRAVTFRSHASLPAEQLSIDTHVAQVEAGLEVPFTATLEPWYSTSELVWEVENGTGTAVIDANGIFMGLEPGFVTVHCKSSDDAAICDSSQIEVLKATGLVSSISVRCDGEFEDEIELGETVQMIATVKPGNAMNKEVAWEVENGTGTATITEDGALTGLTCGTVTVFAIAQDGSEVIGSRVVEIMRYVTDIRVLLNGREDFTQLGVEESAKLTAIYTPEDASYPNGKITVENGTGEATYQDGYLKGITAGTVVLKVTANDSRQLTVTREIEIVGEKAAYGVAGGNLYYNTVTGTVIGCDDTATSANIPAIISGTQITAIAPRAFRNRSSLTSVTIPSSVTNIGEYAFYNCTNITSLRFNGSGLKIIGANAFDNCVALINLTIPEGVETIEVQAFYDCDGLTNLTIPGGITTIKNGAFSSLDSLKELTISGEYDTRNWLSYNGVMDCVTFTGTFVHPAARYEYSDGSYGYESLPGRRARKVVITDTVTEIGEMAFQDRDSIEELIIGSGVTKIGNLAFQNCYNLKHLTLGENVKTIGNSAFRYCSKLTQVILPQGIQSLGIDTFRGCNALESINLPDSLTSVGEGCFRMDESSRLQLIDLSANPTELSGQQLKLTYNLPKALLSAGKNQLRWGFRYGEAEQEAGDPYPWNLAGIDGDTGMLYSQGNGVGAVTVLCRDEYTGAMGTWRIEISSGVVIRTDRQEDYLISGDVMQLSAWIMPGDMEADVMWSLREQDKEFASISASGKLTARAVTAAQQIEVIATPYDGGEAATLKLWIVPRTTGLYIYEGSGDVTGQEMDVDCSRYPSLQFDAVAYPEGALTDVYWQSSNEDIAIVDNGLVTFTGLGKVTITVYADDGSGKSASVKLNVSFQNSAKELTAALDVADNTLRTGETAQLLVYGADPDVPMDPELLEFGIPGSQQDIATVDAYGLITAGEKPGTATVTASMVGDPLGRRVSLKITVKARQTEKLILHPTAEAPAQVQMLDESGNVTNESSALVSYSVVLNKADMAPQGYSFLITPEAFHSQGSFRPEKIALKWTSSNTKVATVSANADGTATVTVKPGSDGACIISAVTTDEAKVENRLVLNIRNSAPRLESLKPVLNTYLTEAAALSLVASYENYITDVALLENGEASSRLQVSYAEGTVSFLTKETIPNSSLDLTLQVTCADGITYSFALNAKVKNTAPTVTVKQPEKFNLFYSDSIVPVQITAKDTPVTRVELTDTADFVIREYDRATGMATLGFSESYILDHSRSADAKGTLLVYLEGYEEPVEKSFTLSTTTKKPEVLLTAKSSIINTAISAEHTTGLGFLLKGSETLLDLDRAEVTVTAAFAQSWLEGNRLILELNEGKGGTATIKLQLDNWMSPISLSHKVTVETRIPTLKFSSGTLKLSSIFTDVEDAALAVLSHSNLEISSIGFVSSAKEGTAAREQADKLSILYDPATGEVTARITDPDNVPKTGTYTFLATATLPDGTELKAAKLKVSVNAAAPKVSLKNSTLKLNKVLTGSEVSSTAATLSKGEGYSLVGFQLPSDWEEKDLPLDIGFAEGQLTVSLLDAEAAAKTHSIKLYPVLLHEASGQEMALPTAVTLRVQIYSNARITVALSSKGKLDAVDPESEIRYTVKKITNASGTVTGVSLEGPDADLFDAILNEDGTVSLKLLPGERYSVKRSYKVQFNFTVCGQDVLSQMLSFKVTQSSLKLKAEANAVTLYQSQTAPVTFRINLTEPVVAAMETVTLGSKTSEAFLEALGNEEMDVTLSEDGRTVIAEFHVRNAAALQFGKSYTLYLDVTAAGAAEDGKPTQIKLTVNVKK